MAHVQCFGGPGDTTGWNVVGPVPAARITDTDVIVTGDANTIVHGGRPAQPCSPCAPEASFAGSGGSVTYHPAVQLSVLRTTGTTVRAEPIPALTAGGVAPGNVMQVDLLGAPGAGVALLVSLPTPPLRTPFGDLFVDPRQHVLAFAGSVPASGAVQRLIPVSRVYPPGLAWTLQAATVEGATLRIGNPASVVLH